MKDNYLRYCLNEKGELEDTEQMSIRYYAKDGRFHDIWIHKSDNLWDVLIKLQDECLRYELSSQ